MITGPTPLREEPANVFRPTKKTVVSLVAVGAVIATSGGLAVAASSRAKLEFASSSGEFSACVDRKSGDARVIMPADKCREDEQRIRFNKEGARGAMGVRGNAGRTGAQGKQGEMGAPGQAGTNGMNGSNGEKGADGTNGTNGTDGKDGTNASITTKPAPTSQCANGGTQFDTSTGSTTNAPAYACNGSSGNRSYFLAYDGGITRSSPNFWLGYNPQDAGKTVITANTDIDLTDCAYAATPGRASNDENNVVNGYATVNHFRPGNLSSMIVRTFDSSGQPADLPFSLVINC